MGARLSWLAVKGADKASFLASLGLVERGTASDDFGGAPVCGAFPNGWLVLVSQDAGFDLDEMLPLVSADSLALGCEVEEHVMFSRLRAFSGGAPAWAVTHDPDVDPRDMTVEGEPPPPFTELRSALAAQQADDADGEVDFMFDLPLRLGQKLCGYAHDELFPIVWSIVGEPGRTPVEPSRSIEPSGRLAEAFASEFLPLLEASGWTLAAQDPEFDESAWDVIRLIGGRRQRLNFSFNDDGHDLQFEISFLVFCGPHWADELLLTGAPRVVRSSGTTPGRSFWQRVADQFRSTDVDLFAELVARVKADLAAIDAFLTSGDPDPRIVIRYGSADALRPLDT